MTNVKNATTAATTTTPATANQRTLAAVPAIITRILASNIVAYITTLAVTVCATTSAEPVVALSNGNYTWLLAMMAPFLVVFFDFRRLMHLGASSDYLIAAIVAYAILAVVVSACNTLVHLAIDPLNRNQQVINLMDVCGWTRNGWFVAFLQQTLFLLMVMLFLHMLLSMQTYWYGWLTDVLLIAIIAMFTPIAPLRALLGRFFGLIMLNANPVSHIGVCVLLSAAFCAIELLILKRTTL